MIPFLLADHIVGSRVSLSAFGLDKGYAQELYKFWVGSPGAGALQAILLLIVWIHGSIGIHFWLALKPFYPRARNVLFSVAVLLPALALLGYFQGGRQNAAIGRATRPGERRTDAGARWDRGRERPSPALA